MSDQSQGPGGGWWLASDGKWYPPAPIPPPPPGPDAKQGRAQQKAEARAHRDALKAAGQQHREAQAAQAAFQASPVGKATAAYDSGAGFFQIQLNVSEVARSFWSSSYQGYSVQQKTKPSHADALSEIEAAGWHLEHVGYAYVMTGQVSRDKLLSSGQEIGVMGELVGVYLFRRDEYRRNLMPTS